MRQSRYHLRDLWAGVLGGLGALCPSWSALIGIGLSATILVGWASYWGTRHTVYLEINGAVFRHRTHLRNTWGVLHELGIKTLAGDQVEAPSEEDLIRGAPIRITVARQVLLFHDGTLSQVRTHAVTVAEALADMGAILTPHDQLYLGALPCEPSAQLPELATTSQTRNPVHWLGELSRPVRLSLRRSVPISVQDGAVSIQLHTTARTVGGALYERGLIVYLGDRVFPDLGSEVSPGLRVSIDRSKPVVLDVGGERRMLRTRLSTVGDLLHGEEVALGPKDYVLPDPRAAVYRNLRVAVVRVLDEFYVEEVPIAYRALWEPDGTMDLDQTQERRPGREGARRTRVRVRYENGHEIHRAQEEEWVALQPIDRIINYGTRIALRQVQTASGVLTYWRRIRMLATSYNAATAGTPQTRPWYGITRLGYKARRGLVAIDPRVVNLGQNVYVPGYGYGLAADTGSAILGRRIDLCYDDDNLELWYSWVDVYLLAPAPPSDEITWILPGATP